MLAKRDEGGKCFVAVVAVGVSLVTLCRGACYPDAPLRGLKFVYFAAIQHVFILEVNNPGYI